MPLAIDDNVGSGSHNHSTTDITSGTLLVARGGTGVVTSTGTGNVVLSTSPTFTTPLLGTPTSGTATNLTGGSGITSLGAQTADLNMNGNDIDNIQRGIEDLSTSGTDVDFTEDQLQTISISADTTFTGTGYAIGLSKTLYITTDGTLRTLAFPSTWKFQGTKPTDQAASKVGTLTLTSTTAAEAGVRCAYAVEE